MANINDNNTSSASQNAMILEWMDKGNTITSLQALDMFGCLRLASRIFDLRERGHNIKKEKVTLPSGKMVTRYSLIKD